MLVATIFTGAIAMVSTVLAAPAGTTGTNAISVRSYAPPGGKLATQGQASYYNPSVGTSSCGDLAQDHEMVTALPFRWMPANCEHMVRVSRADGKASVVVKIIDSCRACEATAGYERVVIDLSEGAFKALNFGSTAEGRIEVQWDFV